MSLSKGSKKPIGEMGFFSRLGKLPLEPERKNLYELSGVDDSGGSESLGEMSLVSGDKVIGICGLGALKKSVVVWIGRHRQAPLRRNGYRHSFDGLQRLCDRLRIKPELFPIEHVLIFSENLA